MQTDEIIKIKIPDFAYETALSLAKNRAFKFRNQFITKKLKEKVSDDEILEKHVEGVIGYIGDMCGAIWLGKDPKEIMRNMVLDTDLLTHRDECDFVYKGNRIDVKTEFYPDDKFERAIKRELKEKETYGCRLINDNQFRENSKNIDVYLFATIDDIDPREAEYWYPIGWIMKKRAEEVAPKPMWWSPAGARLWVPAHCIPNKELENPEDIFQIGQNSHPETDNYQLNPKYKSLDRTKFEDLCKQANLL